MTQKLDFITYQKIQDGIIVTIHEEREPTLFEKVHRWAFSFFTALVEFGWNVVTFPVRCVHFISEKLFPDESSDRETEELVCRDSSDTDAPTSIYDEREILIIDKPAQEKVVKGIMKEPGLKKNPIQKQVHFTQV